jgi:hypothetical protein
LTGLQIAALLDPVTTAPIIASYNQTTAEQAAGVTPVNFAYAPLVVDRYGNNTTPGTTDMLSAINSAIAVASALGGGTVLFGPNTYFHSAAIATNKYVILQGNERIGTVLLSSHTGNGITSMWPVNSSTAVHEKVFNLTLKNTNASNTGAGFVDIGGTFINLEYVKIQGFKYSVILCQSELADIDYCDLEFPLTAGLWLVNGNDYSGAPTANAGYTNRIGVYRSQFNNNAGTGTAIIDDGGACHSYTDNNIDGWVNQGRFCGCSSLKISGGELEAATSVPYIFTNVTSVNSNAVGPCYGVVIEDPFIGATGACINVPTALHQTVIVGGYLATSAAAAISGASAITSITAIDIAFGSTTLFDSTPLSYAQIDGTGIQTNRQMTMTSSSLSFVSGALVYSDSHLSLASTVAIQANNGNKFRITFTSNFTAQMGAPTNPEDGQPISIQIFNTSGGTLTNITWNSAFSIPALTYPANGYNRTYTFTYNSTASKWYFEYQSASDIPN